MIYVDDGTVKVGGVVLPGIYKSVEVQHEAQVEEQEVEGSTAKPKQAIGYEDAKVTVSLLLIDGLSSTKEEKLRTIQNLFRKLEQEKPVVHQLVSTHTSIRGVKRVIFKGLTSKESNKSDQLEASIELWEYVPMTITASSSAVGSSGSGGSDASGTGLTKSYAEYLESQRGTAPKISSKTSASPAVDDE